MSENKPPISHMRLWNTQGQLYHILWGLVEAMMKQHVICSYTKWWFSLFFQVI